MHLTLEQLLCENRAAMDVQLRADWLPVQVQSAIMTTAGTTTAKGNPIAEWPSGSRNVTAWDIGSGHVNCSAVLSPGLTFDARFDEYVGFLYGRQASDARQVYPGSYTAIPAYRLNYPNIVVSFLRAQSITVSRRVTNVEKRVGVYFPWVTPPKNARVSVRPWVLVVRPGRSATFRVTFTVRSRSNGFSFGSLTWRDRRGHAVRSVLGLQAIP